MKKTTHIVNAGEISCKGFMSARMQGTDRRTVTRKGSVLRWTCPMETERMIPQKADRKGLFPDMSR